MHPVTKLAQRLFGEGASALHFQQQVYDHLAAGRSVVLQAPTGSGKTFAALAPFVLGTWGAENGPAARKLIYSLPLRVLAGSLREQYREYFSEKAGLDLRFTTQYGGAAEDEFLDLNGSGERGVIFTTIDQTLSGFLGTPLSVPNRLANVLYGSILSGALVFDEFHLLDPEKSFDTALHLLRKSPWPVLVMTATMSTRLRQELCRVLDAEEVVVGEEDLPSIRSQYETTKHLTVEDVPLDGRVLAEKLGERTLVICNTVDRAQGVYGALKKELERRGDRRERMLLHSRFLPEHRRKKEKRLRTWFGEGSRARAVLVATQVVEAGLDISCNVMHTEASPIDSVLQRIGRAARFGTEREARIYVYPPPDTEKPGNFLPYSKEPTLATLDHLRQHPPLRYEHLQRLIDPVLTGVQGGWVQGYENRAPMLEERIHVVRKTLDRAANKELIRHIDNAEVVVAQPRKVEEHGTSPYAYPAIGVRISTLRHRFLKDGGEAHAVAEYSDEAGQERGGRYFTLVPVAAEETWPSLRLIVSPEHAAYDQDLGLRLGRSGTEVFEPEPEAARRYRYEYEEEPYRAHIERVYKYRRVREAPLAAVQRFSVSKRSPIDVKDPERIIDLIIWAHDLAKLADGWQRAHGDRDLIRDGEPLAHGGRLQDVTPPPHAAESAHAAMKLLAHVLKDDDETLETYACAIRAIRTHHSPTTKNLRPYTIRKQRQEYLRRITPVLRPSMADALLQAWDDLTWAASADVVPRWLDQERLDARHDPLYALLVYMLRRSDQLATSEVSRQNEQQAPRSTRGVSNML